MKILIVCSGNTCRSPMAECYLKSFRPDWRVESAGTRARDGSPATDFAQAVVREQGLDLSDHRARSLGSVEERDFDRVLVMSEEHLRDAPADAALLSSLRREGHSVRDPYGGSLADYRITFEEIRHYLDALRPGKGES